MKGLWTTYGMTEAQYRIFLSLRPGCWICDRTRKKDGTLLRLYIDHDHATQRVRGRLCYACNRRLIGRRRDGSVYLKAAYYLDSAFDGRDIEASDRPGRTVVRLPRRNTRAVRRAR